MAWLTRREFLGRSAAGTAGLAGAVLGSVPIVLLYVLFLDYYISGLTTGAVK